MNRLVLTTRYRLPIGIVLGLAVAAMALPVVEQAMDTPSTTSAGVLLSDCDGSLQEVVIHYLPEAADIVLPAYRSFLCQLPADVIVHVVCPNDQAYNDLVGRIGAVSCTLSPIVVSHPVTCWSRDRWLALRLAQSDNSVIVFPPAEEQGAGLWPARLGDGRVAGDLANRLHHVEIERSGLQFDGGDFVCDGDTAFVTPAVMTRNMQRTVHDRDDLVRRLSSALGCHVVLLDEAPNHHAGMFMMAVGNRTVLVGDPAEARRQLAAVDASSQIDQLLGPEGPDFTPETQQRFDAVAARCHEAGYRVIRIPVVPSRDERTYLSYVNVILDERDGRRIVYLPTIDGAPTLNNAARQVWHDLGYVVRPVDCTACYRHFGTLRCLVNVLVRDRTFAQGMSEDKVEKT